MSLPPANVASQKALKCQCEGRRPVEDVGPSNIDIGQSGTLNVAIEKQAERVGEEAVTRFARGRKLADEALKGNIAIADGIGNDLGRLRDELTKTCLSRDVNPQQDRVSEIADKVAASRLMAVGDHVPMVISDTPVQR